MPPRGKQSLKKIKLPSEVPVFPLPGVILFPKVELPLYIFEPRYQKMLSDALAGDKFIAVSLLRKGWDQKEEPYPAHDVIGLGFIKAAVENADGTSYVLLKGMARVRILRYVQMEPYRRAQVCLMPDKIKNSKELRRLHQVLKNLFIQKLRLKSDDPSQKLALPKELEDPVTLSHFVSFTMNANPYLKQDILETTNVNCRIKHLISLLKEELFPPGTQN